MKNRRTGIITTADRARFRKQGNTFDKPPESIEVICKLVNPDPTGGVWYCIEYNPQTRSFYGLVSVPLQIYDEYGYFSYDELLQYEGEYGLGILRDNAFVGTYYLSDLLAGERP